MVFETRKARNLVLLNLATMFAATYLFFDTSILPLYDIVTSTKYDNNISSNRHYDCIYCKTTSNRKNYSNLCKNQNIFPSSIDERLLVAKQLMIDINYFKQCPINSTDSLYPYISSMIESTSSIFHEISLIESGEKIIYNSTPNSPPKWNDLPIELQNEYTFNNSIPFKDWFFSDNIQNANTKYKLKWTENGINIQIGKFLKTGNIHGTYGPQPAKAFYELLTDNKYHSFIEDSNSIVIGSQNPWLEVLLLASGVSNVTTAEYGIIDVEHPQMSWIHPSKFNENFTDVFDVAVQYSSLEHAGLGRYGDPIDPIADIKMMNQISCLVKPNGLMFYGTPTSDDCIAWNGCHYYGPKRLRLMFMHWKIIDVIGDFNLRNKCQHVQPWFVLQNKRGCFRT
eukprot:286702_1